MGELSETRTWDVLVRVWRELFAASHTPGSDTERHCLEGEVHRIYLRLSADVGQPPGCPAQVVRLGDEKG